MIDREFHLRDHDLYRYVFDMAVQIPTGMVSTYGAIARSLGDQAASRAVGMMLAADRERPFKVPCHRVIYSDGRTGWYTGAGKGEERKRELLLSEGVPISDGKVLDLERTVFKDFRIDPILTKMADSQRELALLISEHGDATRFERIAGLDVSYDGDRAFSAMVTVDRYGKVLEERTARCRVNFPYVPGYLGFREMRPYSSLLTKARQDTLYLIDGHGRAHPRHAGIACQFGVVHGIAVGGVAKSVLTGTKKDGSLYIENEEVGRIIKDGQGRERFISVGNRVDLPSLCSLVSSVPHNPTTLAHDLCTRYRKERA